MAGCAQRNRVQIWRFLAETVIACVRGFTSAFALAYFAGFRPDPREICDVSFRPTLLALRGLAQCLAEHLAGQILAELEVGKHGGFPSRWLGFTDITRHSGPIRRTLKAKS